LKLAHEYLKSNKSQTITSTLSFLMALGATYYAGFMSLPYLACNWLFGIRVRLKDIFPLLLVVLFLIIKQYDSVASTVDFIQGFRYFFGYLVALALIGISDLRTALSARSLLIIVCAASYAEFLGVNFFSMSPNDFATNVFTKAHRTIIFGFTRALGITGSPSSSSAMILALHALASFSGQSNLFLTAITLGAWLISYSGTGAALLVIWSIAMINSPSNPLRLSVGLRRMLFSGLAASAIGGLVAVAVSGKFTKFSLRYLKYIWTFKMEQISLYLPFLESKDAWQAMFGLPLGYRENFFGGDFAWLDSVAYGGIFYVGIVTLSMALNVNRCNAISLAILLIGHFHYGTFTTVSGQVLTAFIMTYRPKKF
jgi:hypothetical protein